jgi:hypothetical protein
MAMVSTTNRKSKVHITGDKSDVHRFSGQKVKINKAEIFRKYDISLKHTSYSPKVCVISLLLRLEIRNTLIGYSENPVKKTIFCWFY